MSRLIVHLALLVLVTGCAAPRSNHSSPRSFEFQHDTFAFSNELVWVYEVDPSTGKTVSRKREPKPEYALHCFVLVRSARQFFQHVRFDPVRPKTDEATYQQLIKSVARTNARVGRQSAVNKHESAQPIVIPGYAHLREFSAVHEQLLKANLGGAWQSYLQRGNWRLIFPFTRGHQQRTAEQLARSLDGQQLPIVHLVRFPALTINHALLLFGLKETSSGMEFLAYDPNIPAHPVTLVFDRDKRAFFFAASHYFSGGRVDVYEIYRGMVY